MPQRPGLRPRLLAAVVRSNATLAFAAERQVVGQTAMKYEVVAGDVVIGWSELEAGDPPMGVASGRLHPTSAYVGVSVDVTLRVRPEGASFFEPAAGVYIEDHSADLGPEGIEVSVLGLDAAVYELHFPQHVRAYERQFKK